MTTSAGVALKFDSGEWLDRPSATLFGEIGFFYIIPSSPTNPDTFWGTVVIAGQLTWKQLGGTGAAGAMKYFVNNSPTAGPQPLCLFSTIAAAQAAAVADGHDTSNPAVLWLLPTALPFTENVTMAAGISMQGAVSACQGAAVPVITGIVDAGLTATGGSVCLSDLVINGQLICVGTKATNVQIDNVFVNQTGNNSPVSFTDPSLVVNSNRLFVACLPASVFPAVDITGTVSWTATEGQIITDSDRVAISAVNAAGALTVNMTEVRLQGTIAMTNKVSITMRQGRIVTASTMCTFTTDGTLSLLRCEVDITNGTLIATGPGTVIDVDCFFPHGTTGVGVTVVTSTVRFTSRLHTEFEFAGAGPYAVTTLFDLYLVDTASGGAGNKTVNLPALNTVPQGVRLRFQKQITTANTLILARNGGAATIGGIAADLVLAAGSLTGATLQAGATDWRIAAN